MNEFDVFDEEPFSSVTNFLLDRRENPKLLQRLQEIQDESAEMGDSGFVDTDFEPYYDPAYSTNYDSNTPTPEPFNMAREREARDQRVAAVNRALEMSRGPIEMNERSPFDDRPEPKEEKKVEVVHNPMSIRFVDELMDGDHPDSLSQTFLDGYSPLKTEKDRILFVHSIFKILDAKGQGALFNIELKQAILRFMKEEDYEYDELKAMTDLLSKKYQFRSDLDYLF